MLQCVALMCSVYQCVAVELEVALENTTEALVLWSLYAFRVMHSVLQCNTLQHTTTHVQTHCNTLQRSQHTATHCNTQLIEDDPLYYRKE